MKASRAFVLLLLFPMAPLAHGQKAENKLPKKVIGATVCGILDDPSGYNTS
jgi:hypothetical protein